jgi:hypothetical protein
MTSVIKDASDIDMRNKFVPSSSQQSMNDRVLAFADPSVEVEKLEVEKLEVKKLRFPSSPYVVNKIAIASAPTASGKTTMLMAHTVPELLAYYDVVLFQTTSTDNINDISEKFEDYYADMAGVYFIAQNPGQDIIRKINKSLKRGRKCVVVITHSMFNDIGSEITKITTLGYKKRLFIIKDEASHSSSTSVDAAYAVHGQYSHTIASNVKNNVKNMNVLIECLCTGCDNIRVLGVTGTKTEEQNKKFVNMLSLQIKEDFAKYGIPHHWDNNSILKFMGHTEEYEIPLSDVPIGRYESSELYTIIYEMEHSRSHKSFVGKHDFYELQDVNGVASAEAFGKQTVKFMANLKSVNDSILTLVPEMRNNESLKELITDGPHTSVGVIFAGYDPLDENATGKTQLLWDSSIEQIKLACKSTGQDPNRVLLYTSDKCGLLTDKPLTEFGIPLTFQESIDGGHVDIVVVKGKLTDGYDEPRFKFMLTSRQLEQQVRKRNSHNPSILKAGQWMGRVLRVNNQLIGVWNREQLNAFLATLKVSDPEAYSLCVKWATLTNCSEFHLPSSPTMSYAMLVNVKDSGQLSEFNADIGYDVGNSIENFHGSNSAWVQEGSDVYRKYAEANPACEYCEKMEYANQGRGWAVGTPKCEIGYLLQGLTREEIWNNNHVDHIDGDHTNNDSSNLMTMCSVQHNIKSINNKDYHNKQYR